MIHLARSRLVQKETWRKMDESRAALMVMKMSWEDYLVASSVLHSKLAGWMALLKRKALQMATRKVEKKHLESQTPPTMVLQYW